MNTNAPAFIPRYKTVRTFDTWPRLNPILNPEEENDLPKPIYRHKTIIYNYNAFHDDPLNSDINYIIERFINKPNKESLRQFIFIEDHKQKILFDYIKNYKPYSDIIMNKNNVIIDYRKKIFKIISKFKDTKLSVLKNDNF
jgi:hypothetical protein